MIKTYVKPLRTIIVSQIIVGLLSGCVLPGSTSISHTVTTDEASGHREEARRLSDSIVDDLLRNNPKSLFTKMEKEVKASHDEESFNASLTHLFAAYGEPIEAEYKQDETGIKTYPDGQSKTMRKFWYSVRTTKHQMGSHFLFVEVVPDENSLAGATFAIVTFSDNVPPSLR